MTGVQTCALPICDFACRAVRTHAVRAAAVARLADCTVRRGCGAQQPRDAAQCQKAAASSISLYAKGMPAGCSLFLLHSEKENGSRVILAFVSQHIRSSQIAYCYTCGLLSAGAAQGKLPEGQKKPLFTLRTILHYSTEWNEKKTDEKSSVFLC